MCHESSKYLSFFLSFLCVQWTTSESLTTKYDATSSLRLPPAVRPIHYLVELKPFLENRFNIEGYVEIDFETLLETNKIFLHMKDIITHNNSLQVSPSVGEPSFVAIQNQTFDSRREFYIVTLSHNLDRGSRYNLKLNFSGTLSDDLEGFYKTSYVNEEGTKIWIGATQFQATSARRAFPCFDEPALKATFKIFLARRPNMTSLSNMPLRDTKPIEPGWVLDEFDTTVPMSTYLLAFVVCDFEYIQSESQELNTTLKLWARKSYIEQAEFGKEISEKGLVYLEDFFNLSFPLPKLDIVAVPELSPNGMENWGLIIARETGLLHSMEQGSAEHLRWVAYLVCHELAHQWFGNIVTMKWWTDLWLNEGFATYIGYRTVDHIKPEMKTLDVFVVKTLQKVMKLDALKSAPPVRIPVESPQQIREVFGEIAYSKGASIIRMMQYFLGEETFRTGLSNYLNELKYKSSEQEDLWNHLTRTAHEMGSLPSDANVGDIMETWTSQPGFPVVTVSREGCSMTLKQRPFELVPSGKVTEGEEARKWFVPITWLTQENPEFEDRIGRVWLGTDSRELHIHGQVPSIDQWVLINPNQIGYFRVNYDNVTWNLLTEQLESNHTAILLVSRAQLIDDALNLAQAGYLDYETALSVTLYLRREREFVPWLAALSNFAHLDGMLRSTRLYGAFKNYVLSVISSLYETLGYEDKDSDETSEMFLRNELTKWACYLGHEGCVETALRQTRDWQSQNQSTRSPVQRNFAYPFYCTAIQEGDEDVWNFMWSRYQDQSEDSGHREIIRNALGCTKEIWMLTRYLEAAFAPESGVSRQDAPLVYQAVAKTPTGSLLAWNHLKQNWNDIKSYIGTSMFALADLVQAVTHHLHTKQHLDEMMSFKNKYDGNFGAAKWSVEQALESTKANLMWSTANLDTIESWLQQRGYSSSLTQ